MWNGIELLVILQNLAEQLPDWVSGFFLFISSPLIYEVIPILIAIYFLWFSDRRKAEFIVLNTISAMSLVHFIKYIFKVQRPWVLNPEINPPVAEAHATGYSLPSGHAAIAGSAFGSFIRFLKNKWAIAGILAFVGLICFARLYLCVHTPLDIIAGLLVAVAVVLINSKVLDWIHLSEENEKKGAIGYFVFFLILTIGTQIMIDEDRNETLIMSGFQLGAILGLYFGNKYFGDFVIGGSVKRKIAIVVPFAILSLSPLLLYILKIEFLSFLCSFVTMMLFCVVIPYLAKKYFSQSAQQ